MALFPGGFGTLDEAMEVLTLLQNGKRYPMPLVLLEEPGGNYWREVLRFFDQQLLERGYIDVTDRALFRLVEGVERAIEEIAGFYRNFQSLRYVGEHMLIRLKKAPDTAQLTHYREAFADLLTPRGSIRIAAESDASPAMGDEPPGTERLVLDFNQSSFGRLRQLIDELNTLPVS